jgi:molybdopterin synthase catalytic subunit
MPSAKFPGARLPSRARFRRVMLMRPHIAVQREDFDPARILADLSGTGEDMGAIASFIGLCRSESGRLAALELEHYPGMAEEEIARVAANAAERWPLLGLSVVHRFGLIRPGERIVIVATASRHRSASLEAAGFLMDFLKTRAPFWKREHLADGTLGAWVAANEADDRAASSWVENGP